jgi:ferritin-like metal-binding protein YciE
MNNTQLQKLFAEQIADLYDAEKQLVKALPKLAAAADNEDLVIAIRGHLSETQEQVQRLEEVFREFGLTPKAKACKAMKGLIAEGGEALEEMGEGELRDLAIISAAQRVEHYEISGYGTARTMAEVLGNENAARLLQVTEDEETAADSKLTEIAAALYTSVNEDRKPATPAARASRSTGSGRGR